MSRQNDSTTHSAKVTIEQNAIVGYGNLSNIRPEYRTRPLRVVLGDGVLIRTNAVVYAGCVFEDNVKIGHNTVVREFTNIGANSFLGSNVVVEGYTTIGHHTAIHSQCHITAKARIGNYVFFGPMVSTANARHPLWPKPTPEESGPTVEDFAMVGTNAVLLPGIRVGERAIIGAGAVVTKDVPPRKIALGVPARITGNVSTLGPVD